MDARSSAPLLDSLTRAGCHATTGSSEAHRRIVPDLGWVPPRLGPVAAGRDYPQSTRYDYLLAAAQLGRYLGRVRYHRAVIPSPIFDSLTEYVAPLENVEFWRPYVERILVRHDLAEQGRELVAGVGGTYPTFLSGDVVVKLFGRFRAWRESYAAERIALRVVGGDPQIGAPRLLADGQLTDDASAPWPYLVSTRMPGKAWGLLGLSEAGRASIAVELGERVRRMQALPTACLPPHPDWAARRATEAARHSSLPAHLVAQVDDYLVGTELTDPVFVHGDLTPRHVFVADGRLSGIIDWGDATASDRHYELAQLHRALFWCDKALLRVFLDAADWPVGPTFARDALRMMLHRQAVGHVQHHSMDVFEPVAAVIPLRDVATLDELAVAVFAV